MTPGRRGAPALVAERPGDYIGAFSWRVLAGVTIGLGLTTMVNTGDGRAPRPAARSAGCGWSVVAFVIFILYERREAALIRLELFRKPSRGERRPFLLGRPFMGWWVLPRQTLGLTR
jgi:hypothetical protein